MVGRGGREERKEKEEKRGLDNKVGSEDGDRRAQARESEVDGKRGQIEGVGGEGRGGEEECCQTVTTLPSRNTIIINKG